MAPGYYAATKNPLCFTDIKKKLERDAYTTFRAFVADFEQVGGSCRLACVQQPALCRLQWIHLCTASPEGMLCTDAHASHTP